MPSRYCLAGTDMTRRSVGASALLVLLILTGCGRQPLPANPHPPKDTAELESRYARLDVGTPESEIAAFLGKPGAEVAGYSTTVVKSKPPAGGEMVAGETDKHWASADATGAIRVVFAPDGTARLIQLLRLRAMGPVSRPPRDANGP